MVGVYNHFGEFIKQKRLTKKSPLGRWLDEYIYLRHFSVTLKKGRRLPLDLLRLDKIATVLELDDEERCFMFDLAGKRRDTVLPTYRDYIKEREYKPQR